MRAPGCAVSLSKPLTCAVSTRHPQSPGLHARPYNDTTVMPEYFYHILLETSPRLNDQKLGKAADCWPSGIGSLEPLANRSAPRKKASASAESGGASLSVSNDTTQEDLAAKAQSLGLREGLPHQPFNASGYTEKLWATQSRQSTLEDKRLDNISIQSVDMVPSGNVAHSNHSHDDQITRGIGSSLSGQRTKGKYVPLDKGLSESAWGIVHLYRDADETSSLYDEGLPPKATKTRHGGTSKELSPLGNQATDPDCTTLCILAVPSYLAPSDFLGFVGEETRDEVSHFRMIRTARANRYMVLMKFRNGKKAREWRKEWNGKVFNSMEVCHCFHPFKGPVTHLLIHHSSRKPAMSSSSNPSRSNPPPRTSLPQQLFPP